MNASKRGQVLLSQAMVARKHTITDASDAIGAGGGTLSRVLDGKRGVGMEDRKSVV